MRELLLDEDALLSSSRTMSTERAREAALQAARRIDPQVDPAQITPTELALTVVYTLGSPRTGVRQNAVQATPGEVRMWGRDFPPSGGAVPARARS